MSTDKHLEDYRRLKAQLEKSIGVPIAGFAFVVVSVSGETYWGSDSGGLNASAEIAIKCASMARAARENIKDIKSKSEA